MTKLNDTQLVLLSAAANRDSGSFYPLPETLTPARTAKALVSLTKAGLMEEREASGSEMVHRTDGDLRYGLFITPAGLQAIGIEEGEGAAAVESAPAAQPRQTKAALVLGLLQAPDGASLADLIAATGWLPHTTRAALTGLRKRGHAIERLKHDGETRYHVVVA